MHLLQANHLPPTPEDYAKQAKEAKEAQLRNEAMLSQISRQLSEHATQQAVNLAKQSEKIDQLLSQIQARSAPRRSDRIANPEIKKHMEPFEQAHQVISQANLEVLFLRDIWMNLLGLCLSSWRTRSQLSRISATKVRRPSSTACTSWRTGIWRVWRLLLRCSVFEMKLQRIPLRSR